MVYHVGPVLGSLQERWRRHMRAIGMYINSLIIYFVGRFCIAFLQQLLLSAPSPLATPLPIFILHFHI